VNRAHFQSGYFLYVPLLISKDAAIIVAAKVTIDIPAFIYILTSPILVTTQAVTATAITAIHITIENANISKDLPKVILEDLDNIQDDAIIAADIAINIRGIIIISLIFILPKRLALANINKVTLNAINIIAIAKPVINCEKLIGLINPNTQDETAIANAIAGKINGIITTAIAILAGSRSFKAVNILLIPQETTANIPAIKIAVIA